MHRLRFLRNRSCGGQRWLAPALLVAATLGCGPASDRLAVSGTVQLDGAPIGTGSIRFEPKGAGRVASGAVIQDGEFAIPAAKGLPPGKYQVAISAPDLDGPIVSMPGQPPGNRERIPKKYNLQSELTVEISRAADNAFNFELKTPT